MNIDIKSIKGEDCACDALIFLFPEDRPEELKKSPLAVAPLIKQVFSKEFSGKQNEVFLMKAPDSVKPARLLLVGLGKTDQISAEKIRQAGGKAATYLRSMGIKKAALSTDYLSVLKISLPNLSKARCWVFILTKDTKKMRTISLLKISPFLRNLPKSLLKD
jgi:leucyl aminopeptidase